MWSQAGLSVQLEPMANWFAALPETKWEFDSPHARRSPAQQDFRRTWSS
jgi:hypothetical protein